MMQIDKKPHSKKIEKVSKSGRVIKTPKAILTTSSDEAPRQRASKKQVHVSTELQRLRDIAKKLLKTKTSVSEHEETASTAISELFQDMLTENPTISTDFEQADPNETWKHHNTFKSPTHECSGIKTAKLIKKSSNTGSSILQFNCRGISPLPSRNEFPNVVEMQNIERDNPIKDLEKSRQKVPKVGFNVVLESLMRTKPGNDSTVSNYIGDKNLEIIERQKQILDGIGQRNIGDEVSANLYEPLEGFPVKTIEQFHEIEDDSKKSVRTKLYLHLRNLGGSRAREFLNSALKEVMTDELVNSFTWPGGKTSAQLGDTKVANILYQVAKKCPLFRGPDTKAEFKTDMLKVLRTTKQRYRNLPKKSLATDQSDETDDDELDEFRSRTNYKKNLTIRGKAKYSFGG